MRILPKPEQDLKFTGFLTMPFTNKSDKWILITGLSLTAGTTNNGEVINITDNANNVLDSITLKSVSIFTGAGASQVAGTFENPLGVQSYIWTMAFLPKKMLLPPQGVISSASGTSYNWSGFVARTQDIALAHI